MYRAETTLFEAGRALAAADDRLEVILDDLCTVVPLSLRQGQTEIASEFFNNHHKENDRIEVIIRHWPGANL